MTESQDDLQCVLKKANSGQLFAALDMAEQLIVNNADPSVELRHRLVLLLARSGALQAARSRYIDLGLDQEDSVDARSLGARILKDDALSRSTETRAQALADACNAYRRIYQETGDSYPGINAATLAAFAGDIPTAKKLAGVILTSLTNVPEDSQSAYWHHATRAEALLLLGKHAETVGAVAAAVATGHDSLDDRASTLKQLRRVAIAIGVDTNILAPLTPQPTLHYSGHMISPPGSSGRILFEHEAELSRRIVTAIDAIAPSAAYGALACGSDILIVEALLARGCDVHIVFPFREDEFIQTSVICGGQDWLDRFNVCREKATSVSFLTNQPYLGDDILYGLAANLAMGHAILRAEFIAGAAVQLAVWDRTPAGGPAGTGADVATWRNTNRPCHIVECADLGRIETPAQTDQADHATGSGRVDAAMLFGDVKGFSKLDDSELPNFVTHVLGAVADALQPETKEVSFSNTWGDGLFAVLRNAPVAAERALALQDAIEDLDGVSLNLPDDLAIRLSLHYGVAHCFIDPVLNRQNYFGEAVARAARIEPITPPGAVYATAPFAAMLALDVERRFAADYVGTVETAKGYGAIALYRIRRSFPGDM